MNIWEKIKKMSIVSAVFTLVYGLFIFTKLAWIFINSNIIAKIDFSAQNWIQTARTPFLNNFFSAITYLGSVTGAIILIIIISSLLYYYKKKLEIIIFWLIIGASELFTYIGKHAVNRTRPGSGLILEESASFPSGHATTAMALYGFIIFLLISKAKSIFQKTSIAILGTILILSIGMSRIYLGVHFVSDVVIGYVIGVIWLMIGVSVYKNIKKG